MPRPRPRPRPPPTLSPLRLLTQIITLQLLYYLCVTTLLLFTSLTAGKPFTPDLVLSWRSLRGDTAAGWTLGVCWLGGSFCGIILLLLLIARSKLVPDFALTLHALHLLATSLYSRALPAHALWWALQAASAALMVAGGVWTCRWRELRPIAFGGTGKGGDGVGMGIGVGGGGYEMVGGAEEGEGVREGGR
ncbi:hypothetical protein IMSHALPRED_005365 [Imshaugia aleurites]|uniref:Integral membrane protein S linking to the trans Golgi network-domain-containing protein n=1 Tax=Imshaugia aleurites TaxID=172621 RepID=A0A8H3EJN7_9LECA|nr:hypothetical protein IMSHALPRED_005365 [Imshaugia aleurites]